MVKSKHTAQKIEVLLDKIDGFDTTSKYTAQERDALLDKINAFDTSTKYTNPQRDALLDKINSFDVANTHSGLKLMAKVYLAPDGTSSLVTGSPDVKAISVWYSGGDDIYKVSFYSDLAKTQRITLSWANDYFIFNLQNLSRGQGFPQVHSDLVLIDCSGGDTFGGLLFFKTV